jgi:outer membrane receptor for ferrienterochelin and colicins
MKILLPHSYSHFSKYALFFLCFFHWESKAAIRDSVIKPEVIVTGSLKELRRDEFAIPVQIYDASYFRSQQVTNVQDALRMISGIQSNIDGALDGSGDIEINGQEGSYTLVMIDGVPISGGNATVYAVSGIPISFIERIEVIQGPSSTVYGTDAVAGVINIITTSPEKAASFFVEAGTTSMLESNAEMGFRVKAGKLNGLFAVSNFNQPLKWDMNRDRFMDVLQQNRFSLFNKWSVRDKYLRQSSLWFRYTNDRRAGGETDWAPKYEGSDYIYGESIKVNRYELSGNYALPFAVENFNAIFSYTHQNQNSFYGFIPFQSREQNVLAQLLYDKKIARRSELMAGVGYRFYWYDDNLSGTASDTAVNAANKPFKNHMPSFFLQDMMHLSEQSELLAGIRFEYTSVNNDFAICPRIDYKWSTIDKMHSVRIGFGSGFRTPNLFVDDRISFTQGKKVVFAERVKNELSYGGHLHYDLKRKAGKAMVKFDSRLFANAIINVVEANFDENANTIFIENEDGRVLYFGLQSNAEVSWPIGFYAKAGFTLQRSLLFEKEDEVTTVSEVVNSPLFNLVYDIGYRNPDKGWNVSIYGWLNSPMKMRTQQNDIRPEFSPWYGWLNFTVAKTFPNNVGLRLGLNNILNLRPKNIFVRANDPFNYGINDPINNPRGLAFDTQYLYAPNKGVHAFVAITYTLR